MNVSSFGGLGNEEEEENLMGLVHGGVHTNESCANTTGVGGTNGTDINPFYYFEVTHDSLFLKYFPVFIAPV